MTTTWQIFDTKYQKTDGLIINITYACTVQLDSFIDRTMGELEVTGDPSKEGFIPYANLNEQIILGWVKSSLGQAKVTEIETALQDSVTAQKTAKEAEEVQNGLPWRTF